MKQAFLVNILIQNDSLVLKHKLLCLKLPVQSQCPVLIKTFFPILFGPGVPSTNKRCIELTVWSQENLAPEISKIASSKSSLGSVRETRLIWYVCRLWDMVFSLVLGIYLHLGNNETRKRKEQRLIFKLGTLAPNGINERFSFA